MDEGDVIPISSAQHYVAEADEAVAIAKDVLDEHAARLSIQSPTLQEMFKRAQVQLAETAALLHAIQCELSGGNR